MAAKCQNVEVTEFFISVWREEESLWNVSSILYKNRDVKAKSTNALMERCSMSGKSSHKTHKN